MPREYQNSSGQIVLDYAKAIQESVFEQLRVVRDGQLRIVFSSDLKVIQHSNFCKTKYLFMLSNYSLLLSSGPTVIRYALGNFVLGVTRSLSLEDC